MSISIPTYSTVSTSTSTGTVVAGAITFGSATDVEYYTMNTPDNIAAHPHGVYICGRLATIGAICSPADCSYAKESIIFKKRSIVAIVYGDEISISLMYEDKTYHYTIQYDGHMPQIIDGTNILDIQLLSVITH